MTIDEYLRREDFDAHYFAHLIGIEKKASSVLRKLVSVVQSAEDAFLFMKYWNTYDYCNSKIFDASCDLHEHKLIHNKMSLQDFILLYGKDRTYALSVLFQHEVSASDVKELNKFNVEAINIYTLHLEDRNIPLYRLIPRLTILKDHLQLAH